jgi:hypothetical protein
VAITLDEPIWNGSDDEADGLDDGQQPVRKVGRTGARFGSAATQRRIQRSEQDELDEVVDTITQSEPHRRAARPEVGRTGARFGSKTTRKRIQESAPDPDPDLDALAAETPNRNDGLTVGKTGARFGFTTTQRRMHEDDDEAAEFDRQLFDDDPPTEELPIIEAEMEVEELESVHSRVRPYARTGGRTTASYELQLETLLSVHSRVKASPSLLAGLDHRSIVETCFAPRSVAEVAAVQAIPLGVAKVLISDLIELGVLTAHRVAVAANRAPSQALLERVLDGLRKL